jgi:tripartite-type tricarboxylate transporter receptor subunit TctC
VRQFLRSEGARAVAPLNRTTAVEEIMALTTFRFAAGTLAGMLISVAAVAQTSFPTKPLRIISIFAAGGGNDFLCRTVAAKLTENLKQQVIVENRAGANGIIGTDAVARSAPDGYTIGLIPSGHVVNAAIVPKLPFDPVKDFTTVSMLGSSPLVLVVHPSLPVKSVAELRAFAKARPGELTYVSAGVGASGHLGGALFDLLAGTKMLHIPYKGMGPALIDLVSGQVTMSFATAASVGGHIRSGRLRALATTGEKRSPALAQLPTVGETVPGYEFRLWYGFVGPAKLPADIVARLNTELVKALTAADTKKRIESQGVDVESSTPEAFAKLLVSDAGRWAKVVKQAGIVAR